MKDIRIDGVLEPGDDVRLALALDEYHKQTWWKAQRSDTAIYVNSPGGDVEVALKMGRLIRREQNGIVEVSADQSCLSACVLLVAAAKTRWLAGVVGIHRMFFTSTKPMSYSKANTQRRELETEVKAYLKEMNVSPDLYDAMDRISPENLKALSEADLDRYGLTLRDPVYEETLSALGAERLGISRIEYNQRSALAKQICVPPRYQGIKDIRDCYWDVMSGKLVR
jgi:hypothetical protein